MQYIHQLLDKLLQWLKQVLPATISVGSLIYNYMLRRIEEIKAQKSKVELQKKYLENEKDVLKKYNSQSSSRIIRDAIARGRKHRQKH